MLRKGLYEVEQIIGKQRINRRVLYRVRWKGFSSEHDSWEPSANLMACRLLLKKYNEDNPTTKESYEKSENVTSVGSKRSLPADGTPNGQGSSPPYKKAKLSKIDLRKKLNKIRAKNQERKGKLLVKKTDVTDQPVGANSSQKSPNNSTLLSGSDILKKTKSIKSKNDLEKKKVRKLKMAVTKEKGYDNNEAVQKVIKGNKDTLKQTKNRKSIDDFLTIKKRMKSGDNLKQMTLFEKDVMHKVFPSVDMSINSLATTTQSSGEAIQFDIYQKTQTDGNKALNRTPKQKSETKNKTNKASVKSKANETVFETLVVSTPEKSFEPETVDLTKSPNDVFFTSSSESIEISDDEEDDDGEVLYSLNPDCDISDGAAVKLKKFAHDNTDNSSVIEIYSGKSNQTKDNSKSGGGKKKKRMTLLGSSKEDKQTWKSNPDSTNVRTVSPPPLKSFTTVKEPSVSPSDNQDPSKPSGPDPVSPEASATETYLADVATSFAVTSVGSDISSLDEVDQQPLSPGSISFKAILDTLPDQLHPGHKRGKKTVKVTATSTSTGCLNSYSGVSSSSPLSSGAGAVERRASVRASECAFRYKQIVVKKCYRFTQIWLNTTTMMKNALNPTVIQEIVSAMNSAKYDDSHLVLFSGFGHVFCSGTDLHYLTTGDRRLAARNMAERIRELTKTFISFPKPVIAAVSGAAVGLGVALLQLCDVVYASDKASFHLPYSQLSQTPEGCSSFTLPNTVGLPSANELLFGGRKITAMEAYQLGLVSQVFWPTLMMQEVIPRAQNMAASSAKALEATKLLVRSHHRSKMELTNETECNLLLERWLSVDCQHAIEAYLANEKNWVAL